MAAQRELKMTLDAPLHDALAGAFADMVGYARAVATDALQDPAVAVHELRRSIRRAQAQLALTGGFVRKRARDWITESLRLAFQGTGELRDAAILKPAVGLAAEALTGDGVVQRLEGELAARRVDPAKVRRVLESRARRLAGIDTLYAANLKSKVRLVDLEQALRETFEGVEARYRRALRSGEPRHLHVFRKDLKRMRYQLELLTERDRPRLDVRLGGRLHRGDSHDPADLAHGPWWHGQRESGAVRAGEPSRRSIITISRRSTCSPRARRAKRSILRANRTRSGTITAGFALDRAVCSREDWSNEAYGSCSFTTPTGIITAARRKTSRNICRKCRLKSISRVSR